MPLVDRQPTVVDSRVEAGEQAVRALQPAVGDRRLPSKQEVVGGKVCGDPGRGALVAMLDVQTVRALSGIEREPVRVQHVPDPAHPFECLWGLASGQGLVEGGSCTLPVPVLEGRPAHIERRRVDRFVIHLAPSMNQARESGRRRSIAQFQEARRPASSRALP